MGYFTPEAAWPRSGETAGQWGSSGLFWTAGQSHSPAATCGHPWDTWAPTTSMGPYSSLGMASAQGVVRAVDKCRGRVGTGTEEGQWNT